MNGCFCNNSFVTLMGCVSMLLLFIWSYTCRCEISDETVDASCIFSTRSSLFTLNPLPTSAWPWNIASINWMRFHIWPYSTSLPINSKRKHQTAPFSCWRRGICPCFLLNHDTKIVGTVFLTHLYILCWHPFWLCQHFRGKCKPFDTFVKISCYEFCTPF